MSDGALFVRRAGEAGPPLLFIHGSAADHATWVMQLTAVPRFARCLVYDRRGSGQSPPAPTGYRVEDHAADAAALVEDLGEPIVVVGSSYGAVIALELTRTRPDLVCGAVLCEPPMPCADLVPALPAGFGCELDRLVVTEGGRAAGAFFLRRVIGDDAFERLPQRWRDRACDEWRQIRADALGLLRYRPRYAELAKVGTAVLLVGGTRSEAFFGDTLSSLELHLPAARRIELSGGHMVHAEAGRAFNAELSTFVRVVTGTPHA